MEKKHSKNDDIINKDEIKSSRGKSIPHSGTKVFQKKPITNKVHEKAKDSKVVKKNLEGFSESVDELKDISKIPLKNKIVKKVSSKNSTISTKERGPERNAKATKSTSKKVEEINTSDGVKKTIAKRAYSSKKAAKVVNSPKVAPKKSSVKSNVINKTINHVNKKTQQVLYAVSPKKSKPKPVIYKKTNTNNKKLIVFIAILSVILILLFYYENFYKSDKFVEPTIVSELVIPVVSSSISTLSVSDTNIVIPPLTSKIEHASYELIIKSGMSAKEIAHLISLSNYVDEGGILNYFNENNLSSKINIGTYYILPSMSYEDIADTICLSDNLSLTIYTGLSIDQIDTLLVKRNLIKRGEFINACTSVSATYGVDYVEGWFLSGKYEITRDLDVNQLALSMFKNTLKTLSPFLGDIDKSNFSVEDILIIASLIQAETNNKDDMSLISEVIHNRLKANMPLGINATTCYEIGNYTSDIAQEVYDKITPYNTRRKKGLVPTPICSVSIESISAAIYPLTGDYLYYNHDKDGNIHMAKTYEDHLANIEGNYKDGI
ncbi:MAG: endolytic transglycosylase MltG [Spirochaetaceae bacterium]|nr:endolytic transglycosylase MltG [Spirochaetaceae bacterium]